MPSQANEDVIDLKQAEGNNFMLVETLLNGTQLVTFFSQTADAFVRVNMTELKAGLSGGNPRFSFIEIGLNEKGYPAILPIPNDSVNRDDISSRLGEDFKQAMLNKKMQVSQALLTANEAFISPIDNKTYPSYYEFLTSDTSLSTAREEGVGSNAILTADVITNNHGSVFYDVGLKVSNLSTVEKPTQVEEDLQAKQVAISFDEDYRSALATMEPVAPIETAEETVMEITGPQSTADTYDIWGQSPAPTATPTQAAAASTIELATYVKSRPQGTPDAEAEAEQKAAEEALRNIDLAEMIRRECNS
jgi:hypothetical protein